jgi:hypothetical protein
MDGGIIAVYRQVNGNGLRVFRRQCPHHQVGTVRCIPVISAHPRVLERHGTSPEAVRLHVLAAS